MLHADLTRSLTVQHLRISAQARDPIHFLHAGAALRGALYTVMSRDFCAHAPGTTCPICWLLALEQPDRSRGKDAPRPLAIEPPLHTTIRRGDHFTFGVTLIGRAAELLPHLLLLCKRAGEQGVGAGRGRFDIRAIREYSPVLDTERLLSTGTRVMPPRLAVTHAQIANVPPHPPTCVTLRLLTPTVIKHAGDVTRTIMPEALLCRVVERVQATVEQFTDSTGSTGSWRQAYIDVRAAAQRLTIGRDATRWVNAWSSSRHPSGKHNLSGVVGELRYDGDPETLAALYGWLLWGQSLHVGNGATKGNGWYQVL